VRTFFTLEGGDSEFANFTLPTLKAFLEAHSQNVPAASNDVLLVKEDVPKRIISMNSRSSGGCLHVLLLLILLPGRPPRLSHSS